MTTSKSYGGVGIKKCPSKSRFLSLTFILNGKSTISHEQNNDSVDIIYKSAKFQVCRIYSKKVAKKEFNSIKSLYA